MEPILEQMSEQFSQQYLGSSPVIKSCGHPTARQVEDDELSDAICLDCLCREINSTVVKNGENGHRRFGFIRNGENVGVGASVENVMIDSLAGFVESPTNSKADNLLFIGALRTILRAIDDDTSRDYLVKRFAQVTDCRITLSAVICQEFILRDEPCLAIFLSKHKFVLEHLIFKIRGAPSSALPYLYRILKACCTGNQLMCPESKTHPVEKRSGAGFDIIFAHTLKITTDIVRILRETEDEETVYSCLDYMTTVFANNLVVYMTFHSDLTVPLCGVFRNVLGRDAPKLQKSVIEILILIIRASNSSSKKNGTSQYTELKESIPRLIVQADVDHQIYDCLNTNDVELINLTMRFFHTLCTKEDFEYERRVPTLELCVRVIGVKLECDGLDTAGIHDFFSECLDNMTPLNYSIQQLVLSLCKNLVPVTNWPSREKLNYFKLLRHCKDVRGVRGYLEILDTLQTLDEKTECELKMVLLVCQYVLECDGDGGENLEGRVLEAILDASYLLPIFGLLRNFRAEEDRDYLSTLVQLLIPRLNKMLHFSKNPPSQCYVAYEIMTFLMGDLDRTGYLQGNVNVEWSMTRIIPFMKYAVTDVDYLKFFVSLLRCNFKSDFVVVPEAENECNSPDFKRLVQNVLFNLENLIQQIVDSTAQSLVWLVMTEILKFFDRRIGYEPREGVGEHISAVKDFIFSSPLTFMIETFILLSGKDVRAVHPLAIHFIDAYVNLVLIAARTSAHNPPTTTTNHEPNTIPPNLSKLFTIVKEFLNLCIDSTSQIGSHPNSEYHSLVVYTNLQVEEVLAVLKMDKELDENGEEKKMDGSDDSDSTQLL